MGVGSGGVGLGSRVRGVCAGMRVMCLGTHLPGPGAAKLVVMVEEGGVKSHS